MTNYYGAALSTPTPTPIPTPTPTPTQAKTQEVVYAMADGLMLLFEEGYKETKLGRTFSANDLADSTVVNRAGQIAASHYVGHVGSWAEFWDKWQAHLKARTQQGHELVFISDGVVWLHHQLQQSYPDHVQILDFYHVMEHLGGVAQEGIRSCQARQAWLNKQRKLLLESQLDMVLVHLEALPAGADSCRQVCNYLENNRARMDYKSYLDRGLCIGSGAIESANKAVVQSRLKRAGQRWSKYGAQHVLDLRTCWMSGDWWRVLGLIEPPNYAMAA